MFEVCSLNEESYELHLLSPSAFLLHTVTEERTLTKIKMNWAEDFIFNFQLEERSLEQYVKEFASGELERSYC